jgi:hypothetical protein
VLSCDRLDSGIDLEVLFTDELNKLFHILFAASLNYRNSG